VVAVAVGAEFFVGSAGEESFVEVGVEFVFGVADVAGGIDLVWGEHGCGGGAVAAGGPGFVGDVVVGFAVAFSAADVGFGVFGGKVFGDEVEVADLAAGVVGGFAGGVGGGGFFVEE